ncbi:hypothetical protein [Haloglycomyces albus]|uniref:hypothetical protein n=1 Tax=Haloglycomyces albus TaxID=526067 RepID=UPI0004B4D78B|nr:hypothetical protein [Haloglycomyces albus]
MSDLSLAFALAAGAVAAVNPCGFALLPIYAGFLINPADGDGGRSLPRTLARAVLFTVIMSLTFALVFGAFGLAFSVAASQVVSPTCHG